MAMPTSSQASGGSSGWDWGTIKSAYGLTDQDISSLKSAGYDANRANTLLEASIGGGGTGTTGTGGSSTSSYALPSTIGGSGLSTSTLIQLAKALGGGGGGGSSQPATVPVGTSPDEQLVNLGAAALNQSAVYNPTPGKVDPVSGVAEVGSPQVTSKVPKAPTGPWTTQPGLFAQARPTSPTPTQTITPTAQPTGVPFTPGRAWATPPPAPTLNLAQGMGQGIPGVMGGGPPPAPGAMGMAMAGPNPTRPGLSPPMTRPTGGATTPAFAALATQKT